MEKDQPPKRRICYAIPGLGVDGRVFKRLRHDLSLIVLEWKLPGHHETISDYASRMAADLPEFPCILIGYSFGGVIAQEIAKQRPVAGLILINTICSENEKPFWLRIMKRIPLYKLAQGSWRIRLLPLYGKRYGISATEDLKILQSMFSDADNRVRMWSVRALANWQGGTPGQGIPVLRLHGAKDHVFPLSGPEEANIQVIHSGRHFMIWQDAETIGEIMVQWLNKL